MMYACNPNYWEAEAGELGGGGYNEPRSCHRTSVWVTERNSVTKKNTKISQVCWCAPVGPAAWEAEVEGSLEPGRQRLQ